MPKDVISPSIRIAMWSGPRNISTAMMRSWENRPDTQVVDEPFYACFLTATGIIHPMQDEVLASQSSNWQTVIDQELSQDLEFPASIQYQKHMTQHMVAPIDMEWFASLRHAFLIRHPADVIASYKEKRGSVGAEDVGFARQCELFEMAKEATGKIPPVIRSSTVLKDPRRSLSALCAALDVPFDDAMLSWPSGRRESDGVWAPHWYNKVEASTGFGAYKPNNPKLSSAELQVVEECLPDYQAMAQHAI